jgi:hypothetical protein
VSGWVEKEAAQYALVVDERAIEGSGRPADAHLPGVACLVRGNRVQIAGVVRAWRAA